MLAFGEFPLIACRYSMVSVNTIEQIRRANLLTLISDAKSIQAVADTIERSHAQVSQWKNMSKRSDSGRPAVIESDSARMIEAKFGKPQGWMDHDHTLWPFTAELLTELTKIPREVVRRIENTIRANLELPVLPKVEAGAPAQPEAPATAAKRRAA